MISQTKKGTFPHWDLERHKKDYLKDDSQLSQPISEDDDSFGL